jgi:aryl-alcohol dehydrogenase-like predicted oxidoreductase
MLPMLATTINDGRMVNRVGLSRKHIFDAVQNSVKRLGTYIDVLQIHRMDPDVPHEEIMRALNDVIEQGWVRYIGASSVSKGFLFCTSRHGSSINTLEISYTNHLNSCVQFFPIPANIYVQMPAWEFQMLQNVAEKHGWHKFISMQNYYNLLYREEEREMIPYCKATGVGLIPVRQTYLKTN